MLTSTNGWSQVAGQTTVVVLNLDFVLGATDAQLQQVISFLNAHNISICLMGPVLTKGADGTGLGLEGYGNPLQLQQACQRIASFGGTVQYFQMDEPLNYGYVDTDPHAEHASLSDLAQQAATSVAMVQSVFPDVQVGQVDTNAVPASAYSTFAADFQKDSGTPISFVNVDVNWSNATTPASYAALLTNLEGIAQSIRGFGAQFGVIDDGVENYTSLSWVQAAEQNMAAVEADPLLRPDISLVDSWMPQPTQLLPEGQDDTLTHVALEEIEIAPLYANGTLTGGQGVTAATIVPPIMEGVTGFGVTMPGITVTAQGGAASSTVFAVLLTDQTGLLTAQAEGAGTVSGSGTTTLRLTGTLADINAELATFRYQAVSTGTETIDVTTYDGVGYIGDNQMVVTNAAPVSATVPQSMTPTALFTAIYGTAPTEADLAPINAALAAGQTLTQAAAAWIAQAQAEATQALQQMTANLPDTATVTSWVNALVSGSSTMAQLRASETGTVQNLLIAVLSVVNPVAAGSPAKISALASQVISGAQTLEQVEAPYLIGSAQGKTDHLPRSAGRWQPVQQHAGRGLYPRIRAGHLAHDHPRANGGAAAALVFSHLEILLHLRHATDGGAACLDHQPARHRHEPQHPSQPVQRRGGAAGHDGVRADAGLGAEQQPGQHLCHRHGNGRPPDRLDHDADRRVAAGRGDGPADAAGHLRLSPGPRPDRPRPLDVRDRDHAHSAAE